MHLGGLFGSLIGLEIANNLVQLWDFQLSVRFLQRVILVDIIWVQFWELKVSLAWTVVLLV